MLQHQLDQAALVNYAAYLYGFGMICMLFLMQRRVNSSLPILWWVVELIRLHWWRWAQILHPVSVLFITGCLLATNIPFQ